MYEHNFRSRSFEFLWFKNLLVLSCLYCWFLIYILVFKKLIKKVLNLNFEIAEDFISIGILTVILGGRFGYVFFYNFEYYLINPVEIIKIWKGGMSFHGALIGLVFHMIIFSYKKTRYY